MSAILPQAHRSRNNFLSPTEMTTNLELEQELAGLVTATEAATSKGMSLQLFKHYLKKPDAPKPVYVGRSRQRFFWEHEIDQWNPKQEEAQ